MLLGKEYPATHSMSTAWYAVDKDGNVAIISSEDNGPIDYHINSQTCITNLVEEDGCVTRDGEVCHILNDDQVLNMVEGLFTDKIKEDFCWSAVIVQIDTDRSKEFIEYINKQKKKYRVRGKYIRAYCLSKLHGIYSINLASYEFGEGTKNPFAKYLIENKIILRWQEHIWWDDCTFEEREVDDSLIQRCPYYIYTNVWDPLEPHKRFNIPKFPVKENQLTEYQKNQCIRLPISFKETPLLFLPYYRPTIFTTSKDDWEFSGDGYCYIKAVLPTGETVYILSYDDIDIKGCYVRKQPVDGEFIKGRPHSLSEDKLL